jgi:2-polyprenyl-6-methoxyphenol hydroxylase-like FAD-dependent oxidoreductase
MPRVVVLGAGVCGTAAAMMLARDGHDVIVLERDPAPVPETSDDAWERWKRDGVGQFRQAHFMQARGRHAIDAELPDVGEALVEAGAVRLDALARMPPSIADRRPQPGDDDLATLTARRPTLEQVFGSAAEQEPGVEIRRGVEVVAVETRLSTGGTHVTGVRTASGHTIDADLVVDAMGRRSSLPAMLGDAVSEEAEDCGFIYYTRFFRSRDGTTPAYLAPMLMPLPSFSLLTLPADAGTWSVTVYIASGDRPLKRLRDERVWTALLRACPLHAHWIDGEPITDVTPMAGVIDRCRGMDGNGTVTGIVALADAWACTNPSLGRGMAMGLVHAALLRDVLAQHADDPPGLARAFAAATEAELMPWYRGTVALDRARLAAIEAERAEISPPPPGDPAAQVRAALGPAMMSDRTAFRAGLEISGCLTLPQEVLARAGFAEHVLAVASEHRGGPPPAPSRKELLELVA